MIRLFPLLVLMGLSACSPVTHTYRRTDSMRMRMIMDRAPAKAEWDQQVQIPCNVDNCGKEAR